MRCLSAAEKMCLIFAIHRKRFGIRIGSFPTSGQGEGVVMITGFIQRRRVIATGPNLGPISRGGRGQTRPVDLLWEM